LYPAEKSRKVIIIRKIFEYLLISIGAGLAALAVEFFLIPHGVIDSGIVGISIMLSELTGISKGLFTTLLNIPFLWFGYKHGGKKFIARCLYAILLFSVLLVVFEQISSNNLDKIIAIIFGALALGVGVGMILRFGGSLDGTEMLSLWISQKTNFSVGAFLMIQNVFIFTASGFVFDWNTALYSMVMYFFVTKLIDMVVEGVDEAKAVMIITADPEKMAEIIMRDLGRSVTYLNGTKGYTGDDVRIIYSVVTRLEISRLRQIVSETDPNSFVTITNLADVVGGHTRKK
jgi:uncharacterized membrane-anchored protein YitT (DUF2179 family)